MRDAFEGLGMAISWVGVVLIALVIVVTALSLRGGGGRARTSFHRKDHRLDRFDRLDRQAAHYRASGALPPWTP
jgi:hypothetical protein